MRFWKRGRKPNLSLELLYEEVTVGRSGWTGRVTSWTFDTDNDTLTVQIVGSKKLYREMRTQ